MVDDAPTRWCKPLNLTFPAILQEKMEATGISQTALAEATNIDRSDLNRLVNGSRPPRPKELIALASHFEVAPAEMLLEPERLQQVQAGVAAYIKAEERIMELELRAAVAEAQLAALRDFTETLIKERLKRASPDLHAVALENIHLQSELSSLRTKVAVSEADRECLERQNAEMRMQIVKRLESAGAQAVFGAARSTWAISSRKKPARQGE